MPPTPTERSSSHRCHWLLAGLMAAVAALVAACKSAPEPPAPVQDSTMPSTEPPSVKGPVPATAGSARASAASTARAYRQDAATHLYGLNAQRVFKGKLPPMLYAIGVLEVDIDRTGKVTRLRWMRAPRHAPEVVAEIERTVRAAAPFPAPTRMGKVTYTDTWLWDKSGHFQLDTLTEGQL
ncbi:energy transducer TonB [Acidovorax radicis]|uniref:energy transducer TonB n=1 Tax=Acidovorax radicis TaxID=758826 RepID=UPI00023769D9